MNYCNPDWKDLPVGWLCNGPEQFQYFKPSRDFDALLLLSGRQTLSSCIYYLCSWLVPSVCRLNIESGPPWQQVSVFPGATTFLEPCFCDLIYWCWAYNSCWHETKQVLLILVHMSIRSKWSLVHACLIPQALGWYTNANAGVPDAACTGW